MLVLTRAMVLVGAAFCAMSAPHLTEEVALSKLGMKHTEPAGPVPMVDPRSAF